MKGFLFVFFSWLDSLADMGNIKKIQFVFQVKKKKNHSSTNAHGH